jgi:hypothetical protein
VNPAYKHLETRLRLGELTLTQWAGILGGVFLAIGWGMYISPFGSYVSLFTAIYLGGIPVLLTFTSTQVEFNLWLYLRSLVAWRRDTDRYVPGAGEVPVHGYRLTEDADEAERRASKEIPELDFEALWE